MSLGMSNMTDFSWSPLRCSQFRDRSTLSSPVWRSLQRKFSSCSCSGCTVVVVVVVGVSVKASSSVVPLGLRVVTTVMSSSDSDIATTSMVVNISFNVVVSYSIIVSVVVVSPVVMDSSNTFSVVVVSSTFSTTLPVVVVSS